MSCLIAFLTAYLVGSIPFGYLVARVVKGIDIREHGSKNIGATNVARVCGRGWGIFVFALDFLKGALPVAGALFVFTELYPARPPGRIRADGTTVYGETPILWAMGEGVAAGVAAILGHMFPVYLKLRGGKGVATAAGVFLVLTPIATGVALGTWAVVVAISRYVSLASICASFVLGMTHLFIDVRAAVGNRLPVTVFALAMMVLVIARHASNIGRLIAGTEPRVGEKRASSGDAAPPPA